MQKTPGQLTTLRSVTVWIAKSQCAKDKRAETASFSELLLSGVISVAFIANRVAAEMSTAFRKLISVATEDKRAEATVNRRDERGAAILRAFHANKHIRGIME